MEWTTEVDLVGRVAVAAFAGLVLGYERERRGHEAGIRTFAVLCAGAAAFGVVSTEGFAAYETAKPEVTRVASQVVVGVGFLGAGLIFRQGFSVQNLTTAAALWATAAVGVAAGVGAVGFAVAVAVLLVALLAVGATSSTMHLPGPLALQQRVRCELAAGTSAGELRGVLGGEEIDVRSWKVEKHAGNVVVELGIRVDGDVAFDRVVELLAARPEVVGLQGHR